MKKAKFGIASRTTILLGRESIARVDSAVNELIKNTYDADSEVCILSFNIENDEIYIIDNGVGMTETTILEEWMFIGTDKKKTDFKSEKNRIKAGEKGIGRFALDKLGSICEMYTKHRESENVIYWRNNWDNFEQSDKTIEQIEAEYDFLPYEKLHQAVPKFLSSFLNDLNKDEGINFDNGTILKITNLRQKWTKNDIETITKSLGFLIPPVEQEDQSFQIFYQESIDDVPAKVSNPIGDEFDYKLFASFEDNEFKIRMERNEFNIRSFSDDIFESIAFKKQGYTKHDFERNSFEFVYSISELLNTKSEQLINSVKQIGPFKFSYVFMKLLMNKNDKEIFKYKDISDKRQIWMNEYAGIKIYRDNFWVKPYGDKDSESFDWLNLDARRAENPDGIGNPSQRWKVRNLQGQGTLFISRIFNSEILDKSSREGIIENNVFSAMKTIIIAIISLFEKDRAYIGRYLKEYYDKINEKQRIKEEGLKLAKKIVQSKTKGTKEYTPETKLAETIEIQAEKEKELIAEINSYRTLATNGLITTSIAHDLKSIQTTLKSRSITLKRLIDQNDVELRDEMLLALKDNDLLLHSWISVLTEQQKSDKRKRKKCDVSDVINRLVKLMKPIAEFKQTTINYLRPLPIYKRALESDFDAIIYNLIINSIEAFEKSTIERVTREIRIELFEKDNKITIKYSDNGDGVSGIFKDPYDIFIYGQTSKLNASGKQIGTGMGMYIVASTINEYQGQYEIEKFKDGFELKIEFPSEARV